MHKTESVLLLDSTDRTVFMLWLNHDIGRLTISIQRKKEKNNTIDVAIPQRYSLRH